MNKRLEASRTAAICTLLPLAGMALPASSEEVFNLEEVTVTAQRREQRLIDVPISISPISMKDIADRGAKSLLDLQYSVPGLSIVESAPGQTREQIRGVSSVSGLPTVGRYLDEMPVNTDLAAQGIDIRLIDMERIEVLRGPQGTLFGEGSMGGTIRYLTAAPDLDKVQFKFDGDAGAIDEGGTNYQTNAVLNLPVVAGTFGVRLAAGYEKRGGWIDNVLSGQHDINSGEIRTFRLKSLWRPSEALSVTLLYQRSESEVDNRNLGDADRAVRAALAGPFEDTYDLLNLVLRYDLGFASLVSSTGYIDRSFTEQHDITSLFVPLLEAPPPLGFGLPSGALSGVGILGTSDITVWSQELRLVSAESELWNWSVGASFRESDWPRVIDTFTVPELLPFNISNSSGHLSDSRAWALFGELTRTLSPKLSATLGLRYYNDERTQDLRTETFGVVSTDRDKETFTSVNPRVNLIYRASDATSMYASASKGFRSGGFNQQSAGRGLVAIPPTFDPEKLWTYELGTKTVQLDGRLSFESAVFFNEWKDIQTFAFAAGSPVTVTANGGKASGYGIDVLLTVRPLDTLTLSLSGGYYGDMEYDSTTIDKQKGDRVDYVPEYTASASAEYRVLFGATPAKFRVDYQYQGDYTVTLRTAVPAVATSDSLSYLNARASIELGDWEVGLYGDNLTNEYGVIAPTVGLQIHDTRPQPRVFGGFVRYSY